MVVHRDLKPEVSPPPNWLPDQRFNAFRLPTPCYSMVCVSMYLKQKDLWQGSTCHCALAFGCIWLHRAWISCHILSLLTVSLGISNKERVLHMSTCMQAR